MVHEMVVLQGTTVQVELNGGSPVQPQLIHEWHKLTKLQHVYCILNCYTITFGMGVLCLGRWQP
jgi:hypothetical protein